MKTPRASRAAWRTYAEIGVTMPQHPTWSFADISTRASVPPLADAAGDARAILAAVDPHMRIRAPPGCVTGGRGQDDSPFRNFFAG